MIKCEYCKSTLLPTDSIFSAYNDRNFCDPDHAYEWSLEKIETLSGQSLKRFYKLEESEDTIAQQAKRIEEMEDLLRQCAQSLEEGLETEGHIEAEHSVFDRTLLEGIKMKVPPPKEDKHE